VPLYFSAKRPTVERDGLLLMVDDDRFPLDGRVPVMRSIRFRTLGCYPLTGAVESEAKTLPEVIQEMLLTTTSERQGRVIDKDGGDASMEKKKQEGYFWGLMPKDDPSLRWDDEIEAMTADPIYKTDALIAEDIDAYLERTSTRACCASSPAAAWTTANRR
jgi:hypothetical protein